MKERLTGREQEYGLVVKLAELKRQTFLEKFRAIRPPNIPDSSLPGTDFYQTAQVQAILNKFRDLGIPFFDSGSNNFWLSNGSRIYIDRTYILEFATPESRIGSLDAVIYEKASENILNLAIKKLMESGDYEEISLYKNNTAPQNGTDIFPESTYGHHQNYMYDAHKIREISDVLMRFIPLSLFLTGSGHVHRNQNGNWRYILSPRVTHIESLEAAGTVDKRPLINTREQPHRFHLISRDATRCEFQTWLVDMTTHLVMRLAEEGWKMPLELSGLSPLAILYEVNESFNSYLVGPDGSWILPKSGIDLIKYNGIFLDAVRQLSDLSEEEKDAISEWERILTILTDKDLNPLVGELDWVTKWKLIEKQRKKHGFELGDIRSWKIDMDYHNISDDPNISWFARLDQGGFIRHLSEKEDILAAMTDPPEDTRAKCRGRLVSLAYHNRRLAEKISSIDWGQAIIRKAQPLTFSFGEAGNPLSNLSPSLEKLYEELGLK